jgi:hypothetical protein
VEISLQRLGFCMRRNFWRSTTRITVQALLVCNTVELPLMLPVPNHGQLDPLCNRCHQCLSGWWMNISAYCGGLVSMPSAKAVDVFGKRVIAPVFVFIAATAFSPKHSGHRCGFANARIRSRVYRFKKKLAAVPRPSWGTAAEVCHSMACSQRNLASADF